MSNLFRYVAAIPGALAGLFLSAFAGDISSRLASTFIDTLLNVRSNRSAALISKLIAANNEAMEICMYDEATSKTLWRIISVEGSTRLEEAAELLEVYWLEISATINFDRLGLSPDQNYGAHLIFKTTVDTVGLDSYQVAHLKRGDLEWMNVVFAKPSSTIARSPYRCIRLPVKWSGDSEWMELELGHFSTDDIIDRSREVVITFKETNTKIKKSGLIVAGVELRPF